MMNSPSFNIPFVCPYEDSYLSLQDFFFCFYFLTDVIPQAVERPKISHTFMAVLVFSTSSTEYSTWLFLSANITLGLFTKHHLFLLQAMIFILKCSSLSIQIILLLHSILVPNFDSSLVYCLAFIFQATLFIIVVSTLNEIFAVVPCIKCYCLPTKYWCQPFITDQRPGA